MKKMMTRITCIIVLVVMLGSIAFADVITIEDEYRAQANKNYRTEENFFYKKGAELSHGWIRPELSVSFEFFCAILASVFAVFFINMILFIKEKNEEKSKYYDMVSCVVKCLIVVFTYFLLLNIFGKSVNYIADDINMFALLAIVMAYILAFYVFLCVLEWKLKKYEIGKGHKIFALVFFIIHVVIVGITAFIWGSNSIKLENDLSSIKDKMSEENYIELRKDIEYITLYGYTKYAKVKNYKIEGVENDYSMSFLEMKNGKKIESEYDVATMNGNGYEMKSDGSVLLDGSDQVVYKIEIAPKKNVPQINMFNWWYTHNYLW